MTPTTCPRCDGRGEIVARSRSVGGGAVNDDWDTCPRCNGNGTVNTPASEPEEASE